MADSTVGRGDSGRVVIYNSGNQISADDFVRAYEEWERRYGRRLRDPDDPDEPVTGDGS